MASGAPSPPTDTAPRNDSDAVEVSSRAPTAHRPSTGAKRTTTREPSSTEATANPLAQGDNTGCAAPDTRTAPPDTDPETSSRVVVDAPTATAASVTSDPTEMSHTSAAWSHGPLHPGTVKETITNMRQPPMDIDPLRKRPANIESPGDERGRTTHPTPPVGQESEMGRRKRENTTPPSLQEGQPGERDGQRACRWR
jgi:hypothetical protein